MIDRIVSRFVAKLRERGVRVSPGESVDAVRALGAVGVEHRAEARAVLQLTLVKNAKELALFAEAFDEFFGGLTDADPSRNPGDVVDEAILSLEEKTRFADPHVEDGERSGAKLVVDDELLDEMDLDLDRLEALDGDPGGGGLRIAVETRRYRGEKAKAASRVHNYTQGPIYVKEELLERWRNHGVKPFLPEEEAAMGEVVARMVRRLKKDVRQMKSRQSRGRLSVIKTLQKNYRNGMVPFVKVLRRKRKDRPRLVVLCDVSYSVSHASRFMLLLLHTLQQGLLDVRSFIFNADIAEVTSLLKNMPVNAVLDQIDGGEVIDLQENSDFGHAFVKFKESCLESLRGRPAVIILGDARNNYNEAHDSVLTEIRERAGYMMWLTPEDRESWTLGDCLMHAYGPRCDRVEVVKNVEELSAVVEQLVRVYSTVGPLAGPSAPPALAPVQSVVRKPWQHGGVTVRA